MAIQVQCSCGKQLRVADEHVGRRVKCPACGEMQTVSAGGNGTAKKPTSKLAPKKPAEPDKGEVVKFECDECGKAMQARADYAGRTTRCPECKAPVVIPDQADMDDEPEELVEAEDKPKNRIQASKPAPKPAKKSLPADDDVEEDRDDDFEEEEERPRKKKGKKKDKKKGGMPVGLLIGLGVGLLILLLGGGGFTAWWFLRGGGGKAPPDLTWVPADAQGFVTVRVSHVWQSAPVQDIKQAAGGANNPFSNLMEQEIGLSPDEIERVTFVGVDAKTQDGWIIYSTHKPYDRKRIQARARVDGVERKHQNRTYLSGPAGSQAVHFSSDRQVIMAPNETAMKACLDHIAQPRTKGKLEKALAEAVSTPVVVGFQVTPDMVALAGQLNAQAPMQPKGPAGAPKNFESPVQNGMLTLTPSNNSLMLELTVTCTNDAKAQEAKKSLEDGRKQLKPMLFAAGFAMKGDDAQALAAVQQLLDTLTCDQKGSDVKVSCTIPTATITKLMKSSLANKALQMGGNPGAIPQQPGPRGPGKK